MTLPLPAALRAAAEGLYALETATGLILAHGTWLARDFARFIQQGTGTAAIDWEAADSTLHASGCPPVPPLAACDTPVWMAAPVIAGGSGTTGSFKCWGEAREAIIASRVTGSREGNRNPA